MSHLKMNSDYGNNFNITCDIDDEGITLNQLFAYFVKMTDIIGYSEVSWHNVIKIFIDDCDDYDFFEWAENVIFDYEHPKENSRQNKNFII